VERSISSPRNKPARTAAQKELVANDMMRKSTSRGKLSSKHKAIRRGAPPLHPCSVTADRLAWTQVAKTGNRRNQDRPKEARRAPRPSHTHPRAPPAPAAAAAARVMPRRRRRRSGRAHRLDRWSLQTMQVSSCDMCVHFVFHNIMKKIFDIFSIIIMKNIFNYIM
jgi:hypothetical protein